jgi:23S rRNA G2445 N2-methylase RlmL
VLEWATFAWPCAGPSRNCRCVGLDILPRALRLADSELTAAGVRHRVELREQDVQDLSDSEAFDVAWLPLPLRPEDVARTAIPV